MMPLFPFPLTGLWVLVSAYVPRSNVTLESSYVGVA